MFRDNPSPQAEDFGLLIARLTLGILILLHGIAKIIHGVDPIAGMMQGAGLPAFFAYAVFLGEVVGPVLLIVGWYARLGALLILLNMIVAVLLAHTGDILALNQHGGWQLELQGMYLFIALALVFTGPGRLSVNSQ